MKRTLVATLFALSCATGMAADGSQSVSHGIGELSGAVVAGSLLPVFVGASLVVESVETFGDGLEVVLKGAADGSKATVRFSGKALEGVSLAAGKALLHHSRVN
jgi:hypothetical protein